MEILYETNPLKYIDHMFMVSGFKLLPENNDIKENNVTRMYCSSSDLVVSFKCGLSYKCSFLYDDKINYVYPNVQELLDYVTNGEDVGLEKSHKMINSLKIFPETFEILIFKKNFDFFILFEKKYKNVHITDHLITITYASICKDNSSNISVEELLEIFNPS